MPLPRPRGATPSPRHELAAASPHVIEGVAPAQFLRLPSKLSMWLNDVDGDCVTAEEAFKVACMNPEVFITDSTVQAWASARGVLNGAVISGVLYMMHKWGFEQGGVNYGDGDKHGIDWTNAPLLQNAIWKSPVKFGVAGDQLEYAVPSPPSNGWLATGFQQDTNEDHCVSLSGYGPISWLASQLGTQIDSNAPGYALFTWSSVGIIDVPSMLAITGEAWIRSPGTVIR